jgi:DNA-binding protein H-NS
MSDLHKNYQAYQELQAQIAALQEKATLLMMEGRATAITDIKALIAAYELKPEELGYPATPSLPKRDRKPEKKRDRTPKGAPKYRDPVSGATWTGTGRTPNWIMDKDWDEFLIEKPVQPEPPLSPPAEYQPTPSQAVDATHAVHQMASSGPAQPAAAWPAGAPAFPRQQ